MPPSAGDTKKPKTVEERYQKKTQLEHILLRPDSYVGSTESTTEKTFVYNHKDKIMEQQQITYVSVVGCYVNYFFDAPFWDWR